MISDAKIIKRIAEKLRDQLLLSLLEAFAAFPPFTVRCATLIFIRSRRVRNVIYVPCEVQHGTDRTTSLFDDAQRQVGAWKRSRPNDHSRGRVTICSSEPAHDIADPVPVTDDSIHIRTLSRSMTSDAGSANPAHGARAGSVSPPAYVISMRQALQYVEHVESRWCVAMNSELASNSLQVIMRGSTCTWWDARELNPILGHIRPYPGHKAGCATKRQRPMLKVRYDAMSYQPLRLKVPWLFVIALISVENRRLACTPSHRTRTPHPRSQQ